MDRIQEIEARHLRKEIPQFRVGDVVDVQVRIKEAQVAEGKDDKKGVKTASKKGEKEAVEKERIQTFTGTVIGRKGSGIRENFTVRRIVAGEGVERVFPIHSPAVANIIVRRPGRARRAKLYYLRERIGKATKTKERREDEAVPGSESQAPGSAEAALTGRREPAAAEPKKKQKSGEPVA